jgi:competence protein ComFC
MNFLNTILNIVFPIKCLSCGKPGEDLCSDCIGELRGAERESEKWIFPLYDYRDKIIKKAVWLLKYNGKKRIADVFGRVLYGRIMEELADLSQLENFNKPLLIPIPLSGQRRRERGFNQTELICEKLIKLDAGENFFLEKNVLIKVKDTEHQARIKNRKERLENIIGSFSIKNKERIKNRNIILIDDVTTTGGTLKEAKKVLKNSGARKIIAFTVAH